MRLYFSTCPFSCNGSHKFLLFLIYFVKWVSHLNYLQDIISPSSICKSILLTKKLQETLLIWSHLHSQLLKISYILHKNNRFYSYIDIIAWMLIIISRSCFASLTIIMFQELLLCEETLIIYNARLHRLNKLYESYKSGQYTQMKGKIFNLKKVFHVND